MLLLTAATEQELSPIIKRLADKNIEFLSLLTGVGLLESSVACTAYLSSPVAANVSLVLNVGVAGAFVGSAANLLDICLADGEVVGDFGISNGNKTMSFEQFKPFTYKVDKEIISRFDSGLKSDSISPVIGNFVSVNSVSATSKRGEFLRDQHQAICENMEGAAVARACLQYNIPFAEIRCVSNMVEDRNIARWTMAESVIRLSEVMANLLPKIIYRDL